MPPCLCPIAACWDVTERWIWLASSPNALLCRSYPLVSNQTYNSDALTHLGGLHQGLAAAELAPTTIRLRWAAGSDGGSPVVEYKVGHPLAQFALCPLDCAMVWSCSADVALA